MLHHPRRVLTPGASSRKRKELEGGPAPSPPAEAEPMVSNQILAGYLAHEFLTRGTLFGQKWDPARAEAAPPVTSESKRPNPIPIRAGPAKPNPHSFKQPQRYAEFALLMKGDGVHVPGVVNPTQLGQWLQM